MNVCVARVPCSVMHHFFCQESLSAAESSAARHTRLPSVCNASQNSQLLPAAGILPSVHISFSIVNTIPFRTKLKVLPVDLNAAALGKVCVEQPELTCPITLNCEAPFIWILWGCLLICVNRIQLALYPPIIIIQFSQKTCPSDCQIKSKLESHDPKQFFLCVNELWRQQIWPWIGFGESAAVTDLTRVGELGIKARVVLFTFLKQQP